MSFKQDNLFRGACFTNVSDVASCRLHKLRSLQKFAKLFERHLHEPKLAFVHVNETHLDAHALLFSLSLLVTKILSDNMEHPVRIFTNVRKDAKTSK